MDHNHANENHPQEQQDDDYYGKNEKEQPPHTHVRRYYNTYQWTYHPATADTKTTRNSSTNNTMLDENDSTTSSNTVGISNQEKNGHIFNINYRREGNPNDPPILLIHGFGANVNHFRYNIPLLVQAGYQVYAVDVLGFGASDKPKDENYSISLWVDLVCDFMQEMSQIMVDNDDDTNK
jgi:hypothetical protein